MSKRANQVLRKKMDALAYSVYRENTIPLKRMYTQVEEIIVLSSAFVAFSPARI